jgi:hypothetical protein
MALVDLGNVTASLFMVSPIVVIVLIIGVEFFFEHLSDIAGLLVGGGLLGLISFAGGLTLYFAWRKRGFSENKEICKVNVQWMEQNSLECRLSQPFTILVSRVEELDAASPVEGLAKELKKYVNMEDAEATAANLLEKIKAQLPKGNGDGDYTLVRWHFPDTPLPDPKQENGGWTFGGPGSYSNTSLLMLIHEEFKTPQRLFDLCPRTETLFANYVSETSARLGDIAVWEYLPELGEPICTPGLVRQYRFTGEIVKPDDSTRAFIHSTELLRAYQGQAGNKIRVETLLEALSIALGEGFFKVATHRGLQAASGSYESEGSLKEFWDKYKVWVIVFVLACVFMSMYFLGVFGPVG